MKCKVKLQRIKKVTLFLVLLGGLCIVFGFLFQPAWYENSTYDTVKGFYGEPENTVETIFLGASTILNGITPMELYENYGICAYNLSTESQPMLASYYWLEEAYKFHSDSLKIVVLDASTLRRTPDIAYYRKAIDHMKFSSVKYHAVKDYTDIFDESIFCLFPLFSYHSRWSQILEEDFDKIQYKTNASVRGYNFSKYQYMDIFLDAGNSYESIEIPEYYVDEMAEERVLNSESLFYAENIIDFCEEHDIKLVLIKTPVISSWSSANHNAVQSFADSHGLDFLDFNYEPLLSEMGYNHAVDSSDGGHMNYYGATKLTSYLGKYLMDACGATDVRGNQKYTYLEEQLEEYKEQVIDVLKLAEQTNVVNYLTAAKDNEHYSIFIMAKDDATGALNDELRDGFTTLGLKGLSTLQYRESYLAVIDKGEVAYDMFGDSDISYEGKLDDNAFFSLKSGGVFSGDIASCEINGVEYAQNHRGLNIVIYDNLNHKVIDTTYFDTWESATRAGLNKEDVLIDALAEGMSYEELSDELKLLYLYNIKCERTKNSILLKQIVGEGGILDFIEFYRNEEDIVIFISAMDEAAGALDDNARKILAQKGLVELSKLEVRDSYLAIIDDGQVMFEQKDHGEKPISMKGIEYSVISGGFDSGNVSSVKINEKEYSDMQRGLNIVVYDKKQQMVIDTASFDTCAIPINISTIESIEK